MHPGSTDGRQMRHRIRTRGEPEGHGRARLRSIQDPGHHVVRLLESIPRASGPVPSTRGKPAPSRARRTAMPAQQGMREPPTSRASTRFAAHLSMCSTNACIASSSSMRPVVPRLRRQECHESKLTGRGLKSPFSRWLQIVARSAYC